MNAEERMEAFSEIFAPWEFEPEAENQRHLDLVDNIEKVKAILKDSKFTKNSLGHSGISFVQVLRQPNEPDYISRAENYANKVESIMTWSAWNKEDDQETFLLKILKSVYAEYMIFLLRMNLAETVEISGSYDYFLEEPVPMSTLNHKGEITKTCEARGFHLFLGVYSDKNNPKVHIKHFTPDPKLLKLKIKVGDWEISSVKPRTEEVEDVHESSESFKNVFILATKRLIENAPRVRDITPISNLTDIGEILDQSTATKNSKNCLGFPRFQVRREEFETQTQENRAEDLAKFVGHNIFAWNKRDYQEKFLYDTFASDYGGFILMLFTSGSIETAEIIASHDDVITDKFPMSILNGSGHKCGGANAEAIHLFLGVHQNSENQNIHVKFLTPYPYQKDLTIIVGDWKISLSKDPDSNESEEDEDYEHISNGTEVYHVPNLHDIMQG